MSVADSMVRALESYIDQTILDVGHVDKYFATSLRLMKDLLRLVDHALSRTFSGSAASYAGIKHQLREQVLSRFKVHEGTKSLCHKTDFCSPNLFGDVPETYRASLLADHHGHLQGSRKRSYSTGSFPRRKPVAARSSKTVKRSDPYAGLDTPPVSNRVRGKTSHRFRGKGRGTHK